jgi:hypothetical protein
MRMLLFSAGVLLRCHPQRRVLAGAASTGCILVQLQGVSCLTALQLIACQPRVRSRSFHFMSSSVSRMSQEGVMRL